MSHSCTVCNKSFSTSSNRSRHQNTAHGPNPVSQSSIVVNGSSVMQHPFTCIVAGCTQSGKTVWVKSLLENAQKTISPPPQRLIWCYGQWQPSYFDMLRTMPGIEFNKFLNRICKQILRRVYDPSEGRQKLLLYKILLV